MDFCISLKVWAKTWAKVLVKLEVKGWVANTTTKFLIMLNNLQLMTASANKQYTSR